MLNKMAVAAVTGGLFTCPMAAYADAASEIATAAEHAGTQNNAAVLCEDRRPDNEVRCRCFILKRDEHHAFGRSRHLPDEHKTCIYRVVQEALHNCSRHSNATTIRVRVQQKAGVLLLSIQDDGKGFDSWQSDGGHGLTNIRRRAENIAGRVEILAEAGQGTMIALWAPLHRGLRRLKVTT